VAAPNPVSPYWLTPLSLPPLLFLVGRWVPHLSLVALLPYRAAASCVGCTEGLCQRRPARVVVRWQAVSSREVRDRATCHAIHRLGFPILPECHVRVQLVFIFHVLKLNPNPSHTGILVKSFTHFFINMTNIGDSIKIPRKNF
jgi:hypothetical protein